LIKTAETLHLHFATLLGISTGYNQGMFRASNYFVSLKVDLQMPLLHLEVYKLGNG
jgi:hypothetical protein